MAKQGLQESDGWGRLTSELDDLLERSDLVNACEKLQSLQKSLVAQRLISGQSEREAQVEGFKNRMEAMASPAVVNCFTTGDIGKIRNEIIKLILIIFDVAVISEKSKKHVESFAIMERLPQLTQYYRTVQKNLLQQQWSETVELGLNSSSTTFLREFYDGLFENWQKQYKWCQHVFGTSGITHPTVVLIELLNSLQPTRESVLTNLLKRSNDKIIILQELSSANVTFAQNICKLIIESVEQKHLVNNLVAAIFDWFQNFIGQFAAIEQHFIVTAMTDLQLTHSTAAESVRALGSANIKIIKLCEGALTHCETITQNCGLPALIIVFNVSLLNQKVMKNKIKFLFSVYFQNIP